MCIRDKSKSAVGIVGSGVIFVSFLTSCYLFGYVDGAAANSGGAPINSVVTLFDFIKIDAFTIPLAFLVYQLSVLLLLLTM